MPNRDQLNKLYNKLIGKTYSNLMGESGYNLYRPRYTATNNEAQLAASSLVLRVDPASSQYAETAFKGPQYYSVFCNRDIIRPGDLIVKGTYNQPTLDRPYITFLHQGPEKEAVGFRTSQKCHIATKRNQNTGEFTYILKNVWYDLIDIGLPQGRINEGNIHSTRIPTQNLVFYTRSNVFIDLRSTVIDINPATGAETGFYWIVKQVDRSGQITVLTVEANLDGY